MRVEYSSNNSGGSWWLSDKNWLALEAAGWAVVWGGNWFHDSTYDRAPRPEHVSDECDNANAKGDCQGHQKFLSAAQMGKDDRWLGALAKDASKEFASLADGIREWESIVGMEASDEGCNCCGAPHSFSTGIEYASGDSIVGVLYAGAPTSLREAAKRLNRSRP